MGETVVLLQLAVLPFKLTFNLAPSSSSPPNNLSSGCVLVELLLWKHPHQDSCLTVFAGDDCHLTCLCFSEVGDW